MKKTDREREGKKGKRKGAGNFQDKTIKKCGALFARQSESERVSECVSERERGS